MNQLDKDRELFLKLKLIKLRAQLENAQNKYRQCAANVNERTMTPKDTLTDAIKWHREMRAISEIINDTFQEMKLGTLINILVAHED